MRTTKVRPMRRAVAGCALLCALACGSARERAATPVAADEAGARVAEVLALDDALERVAQLGALLPRVPHGALPDVIAAFDASPLDGLDPEYVLLAIWWARFDPLEAAAWGVGNPRATSYAVVSAVFRTWAHDAPKGAWARAQRLPPESIDLARAAAMAGWEETDPDGATAFVRSIEVLTERQRAASLLARRRVLSLGGAGAIAWVQSLPADGFRTELENRIAGEAAVVDPEAALPWAEERIGDASRITGLPRRIGTRWARTDPLAAMAWLASLPYGRDRDDGVMETFRDWRAQNRTGATAWISQQEPAPWLEPALALYADQLAMERPEEGLSLVAGFDDTTLRNRFTVTIARKWMRREPDAAKAWIERAGLPDAVRERIRVVPERAGAEDAPSPAAEVSPRA